MGLTGYLHRCSASRSNRGDVDVMFLQSGMELCQGIELPPVVGIKKGDVFTARPAQGQIARRIGATPAAVQQVQATRICHREFAETLSRTIRGTVVNDDQFNIAIALTQCGANRLRHVGRCVEQGMITEMRGAAGTSVIAWRRARP